MVECERRGRSSLRRRASLMVVAAAADAGGGGGVSSTHWPHVRVAAVVAHVMLVLLIKSVTHTHTHTHTSLTALCPGIPGRAGTRKVKPMWWILLKQETVSGSGISWAICKSAPRSRQIATPAPHHSVSKQVSKLPACQVCVE